MSNAIASLWQISKATGIALDKSIKDVNEVPYTISYVIRKRILIDNLSELPKDKRPPNKLIFDGKYSELEDWIEGALNGIKNNDKIVINLDEVE